jgi:hypothetical protein
MPIAKRLTAKNIGKTTLAATISATIYAATLQAQPFGNGEGWISGSSGIYTRDFVVNDHDSHINMEETPCVTLCDVI